MNRTGVIFFMAVGLVLLAIVLYQTFFQTSAEHQTNETGIYERIISLSPNITETLFALGIGEKLVGVTRFCNYPEAARSLPKVGGYLDLNYEAIVQLRPDLVVLTDDFQQSQALLSQLGIKYLSVTNKTVSDIRTSIAELGTVFGVRARADRILKDIDEKISAMQQRTTTGERPKVLIVIERTLGTGVIRDAYVAGRKTFYDELIQMAGGINAYYDERIAYPTLSAEGIIHLNPKIIIDLIPQLEQTGLDSVTVAKDWDSLSQVDAVKNRRVYIISADYAVIPGPRFIVFLEDLARIIHG